MNLLTGKAQTDFETWYINHIRKNRKDYNQFSDVTILGKLKRAGAITQNAFAVEFFHSFGVFICINPVYLVEYVAYGVYVDDKDVGEGWTDYKTLTEATEAAISKAVELYNKKYESTK